MERSEVLLVEARQFLHNGLKVVVPNLFGFTEEARQVKKTIVIAPGPKKKWNRDSFFQHAAEHLESNQFGAVKKIFKKCEDLHCELFWGRGKIHGSFSVKWPHIGNNALLTMWSNGGLAINFGSFNKNETEEKFRDFFKEQITNKMNLQVPEDYKNRYPNYKISQWAPKVEIMTDILDKTMEQFPNQDT